MSALLAEPEQTVTTPTIGSLLRRSRFWLIAAAIVAVVVVGYTLLTPPSLTDQPLATTSTGMTGSKALVQVLRAHGVRVTPTTSLAGARSAVTNPAHTTVVLYDPDRYLSADQLAGVRRLARNLVVISPGAKEVNTLDPNITLIGTSAAAPVAHCPLPAAANAARIADGGHAYRLAAGSSSYSRCFPSGDNDFTLIQHHTATGDFTVVGSTKSFENRYIGDRGNAALAINLLGASDNLVWYLPSLEDVGASGATVTPAAAAPAWFSAFSVLVLLVVLSAAIWRGRRFGPLVTEQMPVVVRSSETMEGRGRLYQASSARTRALDSLRIGTLTRVAGMCGLPRSADIDQIAAAVSAVTGQHLTEVREVLVESVPRSDAELVRQSDDLLRLESAVVEATGAGARSTGPREQGE